MNVIKNETIITREFGVVAPNTEEYKQLASVNKNDTKGLWALATVEVTDSDGDVVRVNGISLDKHNPPVSYIPILAQHTRTGAAGECTVLGRIEEFKRINVLVDGEETPALAFYMTFDLDKEGKPVDKLVESYYKRMIGPRPSMSAFSVGMLVTDFKETAKGVDYIKTSLLEVSVVSIPANSKAHVIKETVMNKENEVTNPETCPNCGKPVMECGCTKADLNEMKPKEVPAPTHVEPEEGKVEPDEPEGVNDNDEDDQFPKNEGRDRLGTKEEPSEPTEVPDEDDEKPEPKEEEGGKHRPTDMCVHGMKAAECELCRSNKTKSPMNLHKALGQILNKLVTIEKSMSARMDYLESSLVSDPSVVAGSDVQATEEVKALNELRTFVKKLKGK